MKTSNLWRATALAATILAAAPAAAVETVFAQIGLTSSAPNFRWVRSGTDGNAVFYTTASGTSTSAGAAPVTFSLVGAPVPLFTVANFFMTGSVSASPAVVSGSAIDQTITSGTFSLTATSGFTYGNLVFAAGDNLLSGSFSSVSIQGNTGQTTASLLGSTAGGSTISFTSPLFNFAPGSELGFTFGLGSLSPALDALSAATTINTFRSTISGTFQSDPAPEFPVGVPEPQSWAMMILGMGLVGFVGRRRRRTVVAG